MRVTLIASLILMASLFLMILAAVALEHEERFRGARALGWALLALCALAFAGAFAYAGWDGIRRGYGFWPLAGRFLTMLYLMKAFDTLFLDWFLLTKSHFFQHFFPETEGCAVYHQFGFNRREQLVRICTLV